MVLFVTLGLVYGLGVFLVKAEENALSHNCILNLEEKIENIQKWRNLENKMRFQLSNGSSCERVKWSIKVNNNTATLTVEDQTRIVKKVNSTQRP